MKVKQKQSLLNKLKLRKLKKTLRQINRLEKAMRQLSDDDLQNQTQIFKQRLAAGETLDDIMVEAFATMREADRRILGMFPFDVQVLGGLALHLGNIAEMKTGEGKTLTATLPLYLNALSGKGAILVTTNEYLAKRDAEEMGQVYQWMGLSVGIGVFDENEEADIDEKRSVYAADITYITGTGLGFDYLSENLADSAESKFMRPFNFVIVDEADAVLLDSAQTPLIISGLPRVQSNLYPAADQFIKVLHEDEEYVVDKDEKYVYLTEEGAAYAQEYFAINDLYSQNYFELNRHINLALRAHHLFEKDKDYVVMDDEVKLLDNRTGRIMEGTRLQSGIHQAIEMKEGVKLTKDSRAIASVTYQSLFNMFPKLSGMTGTGKIAEDELIATYKVPVIVIPTNTPIQRMDYPDKIYTTLPEKLYATMDFVKDLHAKGQPILLVSGTVAVAEIYSRLLLQEGISHNVLTAKNLAKEAQIIKEAGQMGAVTVATSLAGRGTDIKLGKGVRELGGLAVIGTERMQSSREDWQLRGRSGRQGDPGMSQFFISLEDELLVLYSPEWLRHYFDKRQQNKHSKYGQELKGFYFRSALKNAQDKSEDKAEQARQSTIKFDESLRLQRNKIYALRDSLIYEDASLSEKITHIFSEVMNYDLSETLSLTETSVRRYILDNLDYNFHTMPENFNPTSQKDISRLFGEIYQTEIQRKAKRLVTPEKLEEFYRLAVLKAIDQCWVEQVDTLQQLKGMVTMRQLGQRNAVQEYYHESLESYNQMEVILKKQIVRNVMLSVVEDDGQSIYFV